jgi:hypothetical protein
MEGLQREGKQNENTLVLLVLLQTPRLLEPAVVHDGWSGVAGRLQLNQQHHLFFFNLFHYYMNLLVVDDIPFKKHTSFF